MTEQEESERRQDLIERRQERAKAATSVADVLGNSIYATLMRADPREDLIHASFANLH